MASRLTIPATGDRPFGGKAYSGDAGIDLPVLGTHDLQPGERKDLPTGIRLAIPEGYYGRIVSRSSTLRKRGLRAYEGIIDSGFRGELFAYVENTNTHPVTVADGERLVQLIIAPVIEHQIVWTDELPPSDRGINGFGSSDAAALNEVVAKMVYLGGPIDGLSVEDASVWRIDAAAALGQCNIESYDPFAYWRRRDHYSASELVEGNDQRLLASDAALFVMPETIDANRWGVGTPIEIDRFTRNTGRPTALVLPNHWLVPTYITDLWVRNRLALFRRLPDAIDWVVQQLR